MLTIEELDAFQQIKLDEVDIDTLVDLNSVKIDTSLPCEKRMRKILDEGVNPYLFRVGDTISYVLFGSNTIPASAGGSCATGRIVNNKVNSIFNNNYGLYIDVKNGNRNYGIWSNASVIAPACIGNKIKNVYFTGSGYTIDFSQFNIFFVYANQKYSVTLPSASSVATMFGYSTLPSDFACIFTLIYNYNWGNSLVFTNIRNHNGDLASYTLAKGDSITVLCANYPSFHYQILNHSY